MMKAKSNVCGISSCSSSHLSKQAPAVSTGIKDTRHVHVNTQTQAKRRPVCDHESNFSQTEFLIYKMSPSALKG